MDSGVVHSHAHEDEEHHPHNVGSHQEEQHHDHEKKSVMQKVKARAKKMKDTIKNHGHHDQEDHSEDQHVPDDHDLDEEEDAKDKEMVEDPEVHGAPIHESAAIKSATTGQEEPLPEPRVTVVSPDNESYQNTGTDSARTFVGEERNTGQQKANLERPVGLAEDPHDPGTIPQASTAPNYQTKVNDPTGAGSHDQFLPESSTKTDPLYPSAVEKPHYEPMEKPSNQSSYSDKISSATTAIADKAISAKNVLASKLGYGDKGDRNENESRREEHSIGDKPSNQGSYTEKISSATSAIGNTAVSAKNAVTSKLGYGDNGDRDNDKVTTTQGHKNKDASSTRDAVKSKVSGTGTGASSTTWVSMKDYLAEKLRPGDEDRALSEVISESLHKHREGPTKADHGNEGRTLNEVISDAVHKEEEEEEEPDKAEHRPLGKVTESEEVKRRLGTGKEYKGSEENSSGKGVVNKLKDVVGSWLGKPVENQSSLVAGGEELSKNSSGEAGRVSQSGAGAGGRTLQEPSN